MSRLDRAVELIGTQPGCVLELGLGNGRTYDHLRSRLPARTIYVFEREVRAHPDCIPPDHFLLLGDFRDTLPAAASRLDAPAAMVHADIGSGDRAVTAALAEFVGPALAPLLAPGAVIVADQPLAIPGCVAIDLPEGVTPGRYHMYHRETAAA